MRTRKSLKREMISAILISIIVIIVFILGGTVILYRDAEKQNLDLARNSINNVEYSVQTYFEDIYTVYQSMGYSRSVFTFLTEENMEKQWEASKSVQELASFAGKYNSNFKDIMLIKENQEYTSFLDYTHLYDTDLLKIADSVGKNPEQKNDIRLYRSDETEYLLFFYPVYDIFSSRNFRQKIGTIVFVCYTESLQDLFQMNEESEGVCVRLISSTGETAFSSEKQEGNVLLTETGILNTDWKLQGYYQTLLMAEQSWKVFMILLGVLLLVLISLTALSCKIHHLILAPVESMTRQIKEIAGDHSRHIFCEDENEIGDIALHINDMLDEIAKKNEQIISAERRIHESELLKNQAELKALQSQINPHFLYNTLQCIRGLAIQHHVPDIPTITTAMADIFRYSIRSDKMVPLAEELHALQSYLSIVKVRYRERIQSEISVDPGLEEVPVLKMILQPVVENAISYGLEPWSGEKWIHVQIKENGGIVYICIENSGLPVEREKLQMLQECFRYGKPVVQNYRTSIGLTNINNRIRLQYGPEFGIEMKSPADACTNTGTRVTISFPAVSAEEERI